MNFYENPALEIKQPFDVFYVFKIPAYKLLEIAFTDPIRYNDKGELVGTQRSLNEEKRVKEIKEFLQGDEAALPNSIILAANYDKNGLNITDDERRWRFENGNIIIPTGEKLASIIDGQHRLFGFNDANTDTKEMELLCSVYFDLPNALQAQMFATINTTQVKVDKSLAYIQFGFNADRENIQSWSPDKLAIVLYKKFNKERESPFYNHIKVAPQMSEEMKLQLKEQGKTWMISTATVVDGIVRLISANPRKDKYMLQQIPERDRKRSELGDDSSPLRLLYIANQDAVIFTIIMNFFKAAEETVFKFAVANSSITKTVGIQALFDVLRAVLLIDKKDSPSFSGINLKQGRFEEILSRVNNIDFSNNFYQFSGVGRKRIADTILLANSLIVIPDEEDTQPARIRRRKNLIEIQGYLNEGA